MSREPTTGCGGSQEVGQMRFWDASDFQALFVIAPGCELYPGWSTEKCGDPAVTQLLFSLSHQNDCRTAALRLVCMVCAPHLGQLKEGASAGCCRWCGGTAVSFREI